MKIAKGVTAYFGRDKQSLVTFLYRKGFVAALPERDPYPARPQDYTDGRANPMGGHCPYQHHHRYNTIRTTARMAFCVLLLSSNKLSNTQSILSLTAPTHHQHVFLPQLHGHGCIAT